MTTNLSVENGDLRAAIQKFLKQLLEAGVVDALLVPMLSPYGAIIPALVTDPGLLDRADPLAPVLPVNGATLAGRLSGREPRARVGVVLRACELRALVELVKMQQANLESLTLIAVDCAGTYSVPVFQRLSATADGDRLWEALYTSTEKQPDDLRPACRICEHPVYSGADIAIEILGSDLSQGLRVSMRDDLVATLGLRAVEPEPKMDERAKRIERLVAARTVQRDAEFTAMQARLDAEQGVPGVFAACIRCHNCMTVCPICYCKTCVFKSAVFDHEPMQFVHWARQKGACRLPSDTVLFHLTRMNHMALSCVGCGMCTEACPAELPVGLVFRSVGQKLQQTFDYTPGRSTEDPLPLVTFKADEWTEVGE